MFKFFAIMALALLVTVIPPVLFPTLLPTIGWGMWGILVGIVTILAWEKFLM